MPTDAKRVFEEAMSLPPKERAALAGELLWSLDETVDEGVEEAWNAEIARRIADMDSGKTTPIPWPEVRRQIMAEIDARRAHRVRTSRPR